jgi:hemoglobin
MKRIDLLEAIGGSAKCRELSAALYSHVAEDPILRPLFPGKTLRCAVEQFAAFLVQFLDGPSEDAQKRWWLSLRESHLRFTIGQKERDAWLTNMRQALRDVDVSEPMRSALQELFAESSAYLVNTATERGTCPADSAIKTQIRRRWEEQRALDEAIAAVREGELNRVIALVETPLLQSRFKHNRSVLANFAGVLIGSGDSIMADYAQRTLLDHPDLACEYYSGRTLLHAAAAAGHLQIVETLLQLGVCADIQDSSGHTPLYCVSNECALGGSVVRALIRAGATVDACDGVTRCTPLHMAARRGNVEVAETLLDCGANIEARDSRRDTPLRRAVNCGRIGVAALLLAKGADPLSVGSKGLAAAAAARGDAMRTLLQTWAVR